MFEKKNTLPSASAALRLLEKEPKKIHSNVFLSELQKEQVDAIKISRASKKSKGVKKIIEINPQTFEQMTFYLRV